MTHTRSTSYPRPFPSHAPLARRIAWRRLHQGVPAVLIALALLSPAVFMRPALAIAPNGVSTTIVISQVYGGGGNTGATWKNDFIELYNLGSTAVTVTGWSVQYASSTGTSWQKTDLTGTIQPGQYYLIQEAAGSNTAGTAVDLPTPNATGTISMSATTGKVALVSNNTLITSGTSCPTTNVVDFVGFGAANCSETTPTGALSNTNAALRNGSGATDTDSNVSDFTIGAPNPRNLAFGEVAPSVASTVPASGASNVAVASDLSITFSEPVNVTGVWFTLSCTTSGPHTAVATGGPTTFTLNPDTDFVAGDSCTLTVIAAQVTDQDANDPPDAMTVNAVTTFTTIPAVDPCTLPFTRVYAIQGSGATAAITGAVTTQGVVVGDFELPGSLGGFYLQDPAGDGNAATSDGIFVYTGGSSSVNPGDVVRVTGTALDYQDQTEIDTVTSLQVCGTGTVSPVDVTFPVDDATFLERYEGMLVRLPQTMYVTEHFQLGRFGQVVLSADGRLPQPTNVAQPGVAATALQAQNNLNRIILDDDSQFQNPDPIVFGRGGSPLSASNTLRGGDTATGIVGVMSYSWAGNVQSGNAYRVRPVGALGGAASFQPTNPRPGASLAVGGTVRVVGMNLLNFFNTFTGCTGGVAGAAMDCRGADSQAEFDRQWPKTVAAIVAMKPDIVGVNELENDGYGAGSAIRFLVDKLNLATAPNTYAFIDADTATGQTDAMGTDAIRVALLYKPAKVTPVGQTAVLNSVAFVNGGDSAPRARPSLAQAFRVNATDAVFIVDVNHFKSKGSACDVPDAGDGQGNCNQVRLNAAAALMNWLATDPTGTGDPDVLLLGDYNSYALEDPITYIRNSGFINLIDTFLGANAYSYVFDGQWGYLDHALGSSSLVPQVAGVADYHINSDEPSVLDYNTNFKTANLQVTLYAADRFRISDHDPVVEGLNPKAPFGITYGGFSLSRATGRWVQSVTIKNNGTTTATGPITLVLSGLSANATLYAASGTTTVTFPGSPYKNLPALSLAPGASASVTLEFTKTGSSAITYVGHVVAGPGIR